MTDTVQTQVIQVAVCNHARTVQHLELGGEQLEWYIGEFCRDCGQEVLFTVWERNTCLPEGCLHLHTEIEMREDREYAGNGACIRMPYDIEVCIDCGQEEPYADRAVSLLDDDGDDAIPF